jgi:O-methyltransferase
MDFKNLQNKFLNYWRENGDKSLLGYKKSGQLFYELVGVLSLEGNTAEIGVYKGYTSKLIHTFANNTTHYCYDTFCGIVGANENEDIHKDGEFSCDLESVKKNINMQNIIYKIGYFPDTFEEYNHSFKFVHSDTDTYIGTKTTIEKFKDLMVPGGKIMFDDYCWENCPGVEKALHEFREMDNQFIHKPMPKINQYVLIKK